MKRISQWFAQYFSRKNATTATTATTVTTTTKNIKTSTLSQSLKMSPSTTHCVENKDAMDAIEAMDTIDNPHNLHAIPPKENTQKIIPIHAIKPAQSEQMSPLEKLSLKAEQGSLDAQVRLGMMYVLGADGVGQDIKKAYHLLSKAALQNDPTALGLLGNMYEEGLGTEPDLQQAQQLYHKACELGNTESCADLVRLMQ